MPHFNVSEGTGWYAALALVFVALNAFFVAAEFAIVKIRATRLEILAQKGHPLARLSKKIVHDLDAYLSATQLGITLASLGLGWIGEPAFSLIIGGLLNFFGAHLSEVTLRSASLMVAFLFISALHIVLGELVPKSIAIRTAEKVCLLVAVPLRVFYLVFFPFLWILNSLSNGILRMIRIQPIGGPARAHTEEELKLIVEDSLEEGTINVRKWLLLDNALEFSHKTVRSIMVPIERVVCFYLDESIGENLKRAKESGHTRFPLRESNKGKILGFVHMKDVIWQLEHGEIINLFDLARPLLFFGEDKTLEAALIEFQTRKVHIAMVEKRPGQVTGMVTLENVIEELVGDIEDEFDRRAAPSSK
ncbi:MAG: HlyC/CorC family transporter [Deltaproteobacteria bacterium]|nr:HlyC/CorC family transporter [Deltaproteobacteria bacterium]